MFNKFSISRIFYFTARFSMLGKYISISMQVKAISVATLLSNAPTKLYKALTVVSAFFVTITIFVIIWVII